MHINLPPVLIDLDTGFERHNTFNADSAGRGLTRIVGSLTESNVMVLDGPWGSGKTTFVRQWAAQLQSQGHRVVYWDAFRSDHHEDAVFPMLVTLAKEFPKDFNTQNRVKVLMNAARGIATAIPDAAMTVALEMAKLHWTARLLLYVGRAVIKEPKVEKKKEDLFDRRLKRAQDEEAAFEKFQKALSDVVGLPNDSGQSRSLIFIVDELDRCHPPFALNVLERIKHVFSNKQMCFVLVTHLSELAAMVKHAYGLNDPRRYLEKFYQVTVNIDAVLSDGGEDIHGAYIDYLLEQLKVSGSDNRYVAQTLHNLARRHNMRLRMLEHVVRNYVLYRMANRWAAFAKVHHIAAALCVMRAVAPDIYEKALANELTFDAANQFLQLGDWELPHEQDWGAIEAWWRLVAKPDGEEVADEVRERMDRVRGNYNDEIEVHQGVAGSIDEVLVNVGKDISLIWQRTVS